MPKRIIILSLLLTLSGFSRGQINTKLTKDSLIGNIIEQIVIFPQEKIYLHVDKPLYISGERIWFRAYPVDAVLHTPVTHQFVIRNQPSSILPGTKHRNNVNSDHPICERQFTGTRTWSSLLQVKVHLIFILPMPRLIILCWLKVSQLTDW